MIVRGDHTNKSLIFQQLNANDLHFNRIPLPDKLVALKRPGITARNTAYFYDQVEGIEMNLNKRIAFIVNLIFLFGSHSVYGVDTNQKRANGVTARLYRYPNLIRAVAKYESKKERKEPREILILGPGIESGRSSFVPQVYELATYFEWDRITIIDKEKAVLDAVKNSSLQESILKMGKEVIEYEDNYSRIKSGFKKFLKNFFHQHLSQIPDNLAHLNLNLVHEDFQNYNLPYDSIDVLIATKSLAFASFKEPQIVGRYLSALRVGGVAYFAIEEMQGFMGPGGRSKKARTHMDVAKHFAKRYNITKRGRIMDVGGFSFKVKLILPYTKKRTPSRGTWAISYAGYDDKGKLVDLYISTSPIYEIIRLK